MKKFDIVSNLPYNNFSFEETSGTRKGILNFSGINNYFLETVNTISGFNEAVFPLVSFNFGDKDISISNNKHSFRIEKDRVNSKYSLLQLDPDGTGKVEIGTIFSDGGGNRFTDTFNLTYKTGYLNLDVRPRVNGTGVLLSGEGYALPATIVYTTGNQTISGIKNFISGLSINNNLLYYSQPSGFFSGVGITGSGDGGFFLGRNKISQNTLLLKDENIGNSFSTKLIDSIRNWRGIAMSSDGKYQTAVNNAGYIYISNDYGNTWREKDSSRTWVDVSMSSCGKYQTAITNSSPFGNIYVSSDYGNTWILAASSIISPQRIAMSSDGKIQVLAKYTPTQEYVISNDYGNTWTAGDVSSTSGVRAVAISSDGKYITLVGSGTPDRIYISSDYGSTWTTVGPSSIGFSAVAMSSNGQYQVASASSGYIYISSDYGNNWVLETSSGSRSWLSVDINSDGKYIVAGAASGNIYISSNYGETWKSIATSQVWYSIKISSNGKYIIAAAGANYIYISKTDELIDGNLYAENIQVSGTGIFNAIDLNNVDNLSLSGVDVTIQSATVDLNNSVLINAMPQFINETTNFTISGNDNGRVILANASSQITGTIVSGNPTGFNVSIIQINSGIQITGAGAGVVIQSYNNQFRTAGPFATISLLHTGNNRYIMYGNTI
jgi:photosystem II stability/assembly factor-like uncharacterized protein